MMSPSLKPNRIYQHIYAIVRYETDADENTPIDLRVTVKKVVVDPHYAEKEVKRLNDLNKEKSCYYFYQVTRFEDTPVEIQEPLSVQCSAADEPRM
jgi:hypothetical protein